jgi:hypothetical protein
MFSSFVDLVFFVVVYINRLKHAAIRQKIFHHQGREEPEDLLLSEKDLKKYLLLRGLRALRGGFTTRSCAARALQL